MMSLKCILKVVGLTIFVGMNYANAQKPSYLNIEGGVTMTSLYSFQPTNSAFYHPTIGARLGVSWEQEVHSIISLKTGLFGTLKGGQLFQPTAAWRTGHISVPLLVNVAPVEPLRIGIGAELSILVADNLPPIRLNPVTAGIRSEIAWQINPSFRLIAHTTVDMIATHTVSYTDEQGNIESVASYQHVSAGISLAYTIKTFGKQG